MMGRRTALPPCPADRSPSATWKRSGDRRTRIGFKTRFLVSKPLRKRMPLDCRTCWRWQWLALLIVPAAIVAGCARQPEPAPPSAAPEAAPADIAQQVHAFCGTACHPYPPADSFPRKYWRAEVERGFRFFERSGLPLKAPPIESVVRYYEEQ